MQVKVETTQMPDVSEETKSDVNKIADDAIMRDAMCATNKLPKSYQINGWNQVGNVD